MLMLATAGLKPCETTDGSDGETTDCSLCENAADGHDATFDGPLCSTCAETRNVNESIGEGHNV
ncbi:hypothetical protein J2751_002678 [Halorubrum alkaliphilum]|uniref:Uncharacterized protein n=1 Tax=Halorubrum alkaliphilum TaxID=261290 RepID=A0A8T4GHK8_9EURY|nr:hypothetical protein [Halorubrum alkaliphilum]